MAGLKLPKRLREMDMPKAKDVQKQVGDVQKQVGDIQRMISEAVSDAVADRLSGVDLSSVDIKAPKIDLSKVDLKAPALDKTLPRMSRQLREKGSARMKDALPQRAGPSPFPFLIVGILGGLMIGIWAATSASLGPKIRAAVDDAQDRMAKAMAGTRGTPASGWRGYSAGRTAAASDYQGTAPDLGTSAEPVSSTKPRSMSGATVGSTAADEMRSADMSGVEVDAHADS